MSWDHRRPLPCGESPAFPSFCGAPATGTFVHHPPCRRPPQGRRFLPILLVLCCLLLPSLAQASPQQDFDTARAAFKKLSEDEKRNRYRSNWQALEAQFLTLYKNHPTSSFAPKALYYVARVNEELGQRSFLPTDFKVAQDYYNRVATKYDDHSWADDAQWRMARVQHRHLKDLPAARASCKEGLAKFPNGDMKERFAQCLKDVEKAVADKTAPTAAAKESVAPKTQPTASEPTAESAGEAASEQAAKPVVADTTVEKTLSAKGQALNRPAHLLAVNHQSSDEYTRITLQLDKPVQYVHQTLPANAAKKLPHRLYLDLKNVHIANKVRHDLTIADGILRRVRSAQNTPFVTRVVLDLQAMYKFKVFGMESGDGYLLVVDVFAGPDTTASNLPGSPSPRLPEVQAAKRPVSPPRTPEDAAEAASKPSASASKAIVKKPAQPTDDTVVKKKPTKQPTSPVAAETSPVRLPKNLPDPNPAASIPAPVSKAITDYTPPKGPTDQADKLVEQLGLTVGVIMLDPGHGGKDPGAHVGKILEKDINLRFASILGDMLEKEGFEVLYTRTDDTFIPLDERTAMANLKKADLFISIHVNAYATDTVHGMETYFLDLASSDDAVRVAARENAVSTKKISDLQFILTDLMLNSKMQESKALAKKTHRNAIKALRDKTPVKDMGVRSAPFYVLMGARMPSILVELGYITNANERANLQSKAYLTRQAQGLTKGILEYKKQIERYAGL